jgi:hypothetical protein
VEKFPLIAFPKLWNSLEDVALKSISNKIEFNNKLNPLIPRRAFMHG